MEHEQNGSLRAEYGKDILQDMWKRLQKALVTGLCAKSPADEEILSNVPRYERFAFAINMETFLRVEKASADAEKYVLTLGNELDSNETIVRPFMKVLFRLREK